MKHHQCGQPIEDSFNDEMLGGYVIRTDTCYACEKLESMTDDNGQKIELKPGEIAWVEPVYDWRTGEDIVNE